MDSIKYYPLIDADTEGTDKFPLFFTTDEKEILSTHNYYLEEIITKYYRICVGKGGEPEQVNKFTVRCPICGQPMDKVTVGSDKKHLALYTCAECNK